MLDSAAAKPLNPHYLISRVIQILVVISHSLLRLDVAFFQRDPVDLPICIVWELFAIYETVGDHIFRELLFQER